ncbi:putative zinc-binding dehydrogenase family oxidoreductase [Cadophora sp. DSE1049]|nr:putative zinc-binding dehydrogenase family oxidoreductase [Cadophora sp. DSE1049]
MNSLPKTQSAIIANDVGAFIVSSTVQIPPLGDGMILVKNAAVALNPVDTKMEGGYVAPGAILGCDFAGTVVAVGHAVQTLKVGDRISGVVMGMNSLQPTIGAFANYVGAQADLVLKIPDKMSFAEASTLGTVFNTSSLALFKSLALPHSPESPATKPYPVLVYGGSTATGIAAIQLLRLSGLDPIAVCSPHSFPFVKSYGATSVFDYNSPACAANIRALTRQSLRYALDCITSQDSMKLCYAAIGRTGGKYTALDPYPEPIAKTRKVVVPDWVLGSTLLGTDIPWPAPHGRKGSAELKEYGVALTVMLQNLLREGKIRPHPRKVIRGEFADVLKGLETVKSGKMRGEKLVYTFE